MHDRNYTVRSKPRRRKLCESIREVPVGATLTSQSREQCGEKNDTVMFPESSFKPAEDLFEPANILETQTTVHDQSLPRSSGPRLAGEDVMPRSSRPMRPRRRDEEESTGLVARGVFAWRQCGCDSIPCCLRFAAWCGLATWARSVC